ncbi:MAG: hypothetical protein MJY64_00430 [archaeon]|nr:hypothetical protein [archaeon]
MWKTLGKDAMYVELGNVWKQQVVELSINQNNSEKFRDLMSKTDVKHLFNGSTEIHNFILYIPKETTSEEIQIMADVILGVAKDNLDRPFISLDDVYQKSQVVITSDDEPELIGKNRTEGYGSGKIFMPIFESLSRPGRVNSSSLD